MITDIKTACKEIADNTDLNRTYYLCILSTIPVINVGVDKVDVYYGSIMQSKFRTLLYDLDEEYRKTKIFRDIIIIIPNINGGWEVFSTLNKGHLCNSPVIEIGNYPSLHLV